MTFRAIVSGILFALFISTVVYFNDYVIQQTMIIGNHFPIIVFGILILLVLLVNPLLKIVRIFKPLSNMEIAVIGALGLSVCGWPGSGMMRYWSGLLVNSINMVQTNVSWKASHVMSYIPGASYQLGQGHVSDWIGFSAAIKSKGTGNEKCPEQRLWEMLPENVRKIVLSNVEKNNVESSEKEILLNAINQVISQPDFYAGEYFSGVKIEKPLQELLDDIRAGKSEPKNVEYANRMLMTASFPEFIMAPPRGRGVLLADNDSESPAVQNLLMGKEGKKLITPDQIPWKTWMPTIFLWAGLALLVGICSVCLAVVFLPQWKRELLPFPISRFITELTSSDHQDGISLIMKNKLFWYAFSTLVIIHLVNGIHAWVPNFIEIPLKFDFSSLQELFPTARKVSQGGNILWTPQLFPTVIAIAFFLGTDVSFSLGISGFIYLAFMSFMISSGVTMELNSLSAANTNIIRFGSYIGIAFMFLFAGRHYYTNVILGAAGLRRSADTPQSAIWASRIIAVSIVCAVVLLDRYGVDWFFSLPFILLVLLTVSVISRVNAETGTFFMQAFWMPLGVLTAFFGVKAIGPTAYIVMAIMCFILVGDPREALMPFIVNGLHMGTEPSKSSPGGKFSFLIGLMAVIGLFTALIATLMFQYNVGIAAWDNFGVKNVPETVFNSMTKIVSELTAYNDLSQSVSATGLKKLAYMQPDWGRLSWAAGGLSVVIICSVLRMKLSWWPLHPVAFIVFGTYPGSYFTASFLAGWLVKASVVKLSGARGFRSVKPFMVGVIAGEMFAAIGWSIFGTLYYLLTNLIPKSVKIFPS